MVSDFHVLFKKSLRILIAQKYSVFSTKSVTSRSTIQLDFLKSCEVEIEMIFSPYQYALTQNYLLRRLSFPHCTTLSPLL